MTTSSQALILNKLKGVGMTEDNTTPDRYPKFYATVDFNGYITERSTLGELTLMDISSHLGYHDMRHAVKFKRFIAVVPSMTVIYLDYGTEKLREIARVDNSLIIYSPFVVCGSMYRHNEFTIHPVSRNLLEKGLSKIAIQSYDDRVPF